MMFSPPSLFLDGIKRSLIYKVNRLTLQKQLLNLKFHYYEH